MKKIFLFAAAAMVSLSSCVQTNEVYTGGVQEIGFKSGVTRAAVDGTELPAGSAINVAGVWDAEGNDSYVKYFEPTKFVDDAGIYSGEPARYWPNTGKMQFIGYYPYGVGTFTADYTGDVLAGYKVTGIEGTAQHDILYSDLIGPIESPQAGAQAMTFRHALAQLTCTFKTNAKDGNSNVIVKSATINNVVLSGDLTVTAGQPSTFAWDNTSTATTHNFLTAPTAALTESSALVETDPLLVVPGATTTLVVVYSINGGADQTATLTLADYTNDKWEAGNKYVYQFMINANEILFDCNVQDWTEVLVGGGITL